MKHVCQILDFDARLQKFIHCKHKTINYHCTLYRSQTERKTKQNKKQTKKILWRHRRVVAVVISVFFLYNHQQRLNERTTRRTPMLEQHTNASPW